MIRTFPDLYPDELMYSGYARYAYRMGYPDLKNVMEELFGHRHIIASVPFSSHLDYFVTHQPYGDRFTATSLIAEHTLLPFYAPFLPQERLQCLQMDMYEANGPGIYMRIGLMASTVPSPSHLFYCPDCSKEDEKRFGEKYWHRLHQVPGVSICHIHKVWLEQSNVLIHDRKTRHRFIAAEEALRFLNSPRLIDTSSLCDILLFIANAAAWLLQQRELSPGLEFLHAAYKRTLIDRDLAAYNGRIRMAELQKSFTSCFTDEILSYLQCNLNRQSPDNWLARLVRKPDGSQHPLQHLLLLCFLGCPIETFFSKSSDDHPFGTGPWPCLNPASSHYHLRQIEDCKVVHSQYVNGRPVGTFSCACGFVYSRTGPDTSIEDQFRFSKVKTFGQVWETRLQALWENEAVSLREMARQLGVDPLTVKRHATRMSLSFPRARGKTSQLSESQQLRTITHRMPEAATLETYRTAWLTVLQSNPGIGVTKLRRNAPRIYTWLYRNDRTWLKAYTPVPAKITAIHYNRVNWEERDTCLAEEVINAASCLKNLPGRPVHITISAIGREIGQVALLQQHLDKLPKTAEAIKECIESRETYGVRRVKWTEDICMRKYIYSSRWQLIKEAGVTRIAQLPLVKEAIDAAMETLHGLEMQQI